MNGDKSSAAAISYIPHILFIVAQVYCGFFVVFLIVPPLYAILHSYDHNSGINIFIFKDLFFSFPMSWREITGLTTGQKTLLIFSFFPVGFVFAETFYRLTTSIGYMKNVDLGDSKGKMPFDKSDLHDDELFNKLVEKVFKRDKGRIAKSDFQDNTFVMQLLKGVIKTDENDPDYAYFNEDMKDAPQLKKRLEVINVATSRIGQISAIWSHSQGDPDYAYFDENIKDEAQLKKRLKAIPVSLSDRGKILAIWRESPGIKHFKTRYYIQRDIYFQRVWDWENFQSNFCLYLEGTLLVFSFLFGFAILYTGIVSKQFYWVNISNAFSSISGNFWMWACLAILSVSIFLTLLMRNARIRKYESFRYAHKAIKEILTKKEILKNGET